MVPRRDNPELIPPERAGTLCGLFEQRVRRTPGAIAYRWYDPAAHVWTGISWAEIAERVGRWRAAFAREGCAPGARVAIMLPNGVDWVCFEQAALALGLVVVPLFVNDRPENVAYIVRETGARLLFVDGAAWEELRPALADASPARIVVRGETGAAATAVALSRWLEAAPPDADVPRTAAAGDDLATIVFTSGTVGRPKGVMLSHRNLLWNAYASQCSNPVYPDDTFLSFLPLSHMLERTVGHYLPMMTGATVAYARSVTLLGEDLAALSPTVLVSVPRIYERMYGRIQAQLQGRSPVARALFHCAVATGWRRFRHRQGRAGWTPDLLVWPLLRRLVAGRVLDRLGGRIRIAVCGGAPLPAEVARTFIGLGLPLIQGYGLTEAAPVLTGNRLDANEPASVGRALDGVQLETTAQHELLARSPGVMLGYLNDPAATARAIDADGWLHTGDQVRIDAAGYVHITGRLKEIIVLSNGEKIAPQDMEMAIASDPLFEQVMVTGDGRPYLVALLVLNRECWAALAAELALDPDDPAALAAPALAADVAARIDRLTRAFPGYARIRRFHPGLAPWTVENGLLTPTLKLRRERIRETCAAAIEQLYTGH